MIVLIYNANNERPRNRLRGIVHRADFRIVGEARDFATLVTDEYQQVREAWS